MLGAGLVEAPEEVLGAAVEDVAAGGEGTVVCVPPSVTAGGAGALSVAVAGGFLFDPLAYRSEYQPPPFKMKLTELMSLCAVSWPHSGQVLIGSSMMR